MAGSLFDDDLTDAGPAASPSGGSGAAMPGAPLAERLRPSSLDEVIGQSHLLGPGKPSRVAVFLTASYRPHG